MSEHGTTPIPGAIENGDAWYRLEALIPGERVPGWLHAGRTYRGTALEGGDAVRLFAPDASQNAVVSVALLCRVGAPVA